MKKLILLLPVLLLIKSGTAQNPNLDYPFAVKIYNLTSWEQYHKSRQSNETFSFRYNTAQIQILHPTVAFQWKTRKNNFHEAELTHFTLCKKNSKTELINDSTGNVQMLVNGGITNTTLISVRYEYLLNFNKAKDKKIVPALGFGICPYYRYIKFSPKIPTLFPASESYIGARAYIIPRLTFYFSPKLFFDLNIPLCFFDTYYLTDREENPAMTPGERTITEYSYHQFPKILSGRLGVGFKL